MSARRKLGAGLLLFAVALAALLLGLNVSPVVMSSTYYVDSHVTKSSVQPNWLFVLACCLFIGGMALLVLPRRRRDRLP